jgi:exodeoxyribonuclease VII large subunit
MMQGSERIYTPSELNREIKLHLEAGFPRVVLEAEISNLARPASGHLYFSLKDERAQVRCAMFRSSASRLSIQPQNGMMVMARGRISLYEPRGDYQFIVDSLQEAGEGLLQRQFEELKKKLQEEGLFDPGRKRPLPAFPRRIALVTSPSGAAVRDLLHVLQRRWPLARVRLYPVRVQGGEAPAELLGAIRSANRHAWAETLIIGRGGGSLEDLAAFNDEAVARAVAASKIPVVSAVGHETDFSICDFAADLRAPTPSAAAELATPDGEALKDLFARSERQLKGRVTHRLQADSQKLDHLAHRLHQNHPSKRLAEQAERLQRASQLTWKSVQRRISNDITKLESLAHRLATHHPERKLTELESHLKQLSQTLDRQLSASVARRQEKLQGLARMLHAVSPLETMSRGYAIVSTAEGGAVISSVSQVSAGDSVSARLEDGVLDCTVDRIRQS